MSNKQSVQGRWIKVLRSDIDTAPEKFLSIRDCTIARAVKRVYPKLDVVVSGAGLHYFMEDSGRWFEFKSAMDTKYGQLALACTKAEARAIAPFEFYLPREGDTISKVRPTVPRKNKKVTA